MSSSTPSIVYQSDTTSDDTTSRPEMADINRWLPEEWSTLEKKFMQDDVSLKVKRIKDLELAMSEADVRLKSKNEEVSTLADKVSSRDTEICELADVRLNERNKQLEILRADMSLKDKRIIEVVQAKSAVESELTEQAGVLRHKELVISDQAMKIKDLERSEAQQSLEGQEALEKLADLQSELNEANEHANRLLTDLNQVKENAAAAKYRHSAKISTANAISNDLTSKLMARNKELEENEYLLQLKAQRVDELERAAKQKEDQASTEKAALETRLADREKQLSKERQLNASLQERIAQLKSAQAQCVEARKESEKKADDLQADLSSIKAKAQKSEDLLRSTSSALAETKSNLTESTGQNNRMLQELTDQTYLAKKLEQEMKAEKSQLLADTKDIWVSKGDYGGTGVTIRMYRSISEQRVAVVLYEGHRRILVWYGRLDQCVVAIRNWELALCMVEGDQGSSAWVHLIDDVSALQSWLAMQETNVLHGVARLSLE